MKACSNEQSIDKSSNINAHYLDYPLCISPEVKISKHEKWHNSIVVGVKPGRKCACKVEPMINKVEHKIFQMKQFLLNPLKKVYITLQYVTLP